MIGCYVTGILPRPSELIEKTRAYERKRISEEELEKSFAETAETVIKTQVSKGLTYITDGMLQWQDLLRPFAEGLKGVKVGSLARWFNNNTFYRKPIIVDAVERERDIIKDITYLDKLPRDHPWKAVLPAPYTFMSLSENRYYKDETELLFKLAEIINEEIKSLAEAGFKYVQLSDPALVYKPLKPKMEKDRLNLVCDALKVAVKGVPVKVCLQTFFGDFSEILPNALDFPVDDLGIDFYETNIEKLKAYSFEKGVSLGLVDSRSSLVENEEELVKTAKEVIEAVYPSKTRDVFISPNCDLEFLPWKRAEEKIRVISEVAKKLGGILHG